MPDPDRPDVDPTGHAHALHGVPSDAQLMGLDRNTEEGALVALAGSLSPTRPSHQLVAWLVLASFVAPLLLVMLATIF
ncbi:MAG: hypothetical protein GEU96_09915 [Propionibacteriales bacterium]|nr:hypothetical protein [Propionibacteriales bacterium]